MFLVHSVYKFCFEDTLRIHNNFIQAGPVLHAASSKSTSQPIISLPDSRPHHFRIQEATSGSASCQKHHSSNSGQVHQAAAGQACLAAQSTHRGRHHPEQGPVAEGRGRRGGVPCGGGPPCWAQLAATPEQRGAVPVRVHHGSQRGQQASSLTALANL